MRSNSKDLGKTSDTKNREFLLKHTHKMKWNNANWKNMTLYQIFTSSGGNIGEAMN